MRLLDADEQRWYCFKDNEIYYAKEQSWGRKVKETSPQIIAESKESTTAHKVLKTLGFVLAAIGGMVIGVSLGFPPQTVALAIGVVGSIVIGQHFSKPRRNAPQPKTVLSGIGVLGIIGFIVAMFTLVVGVEATFYPVPGAAWGTAVGLQFLAVTFILIAVSIIMIKKGRKPYEPGEGLGRQI